LVYLPIADTGRVTARDCDAPDTHIRCLLQPAQWQDMPLGVFLLVDSWVFPYPTRNT